MSQKGGAGGGCQSSAKKVSRLNWLAPNSVIVNNLSGETKNFGNEISVLKFHFYIFQFENLSQKSISLYNRLFPNDKLFVYIKP